MAFTSWAALKQQILDAMADGSILTRSYAVGDRQRTFHSMKEVMDFLAFCDGQIMSAAGSRANLARFGRG